MPEPLRRESVEEGCETRGFACRPRLILGAQLDEPLRQLQVLLRKRNRLDREDDRAGAVETTLHEDARVSGPLREVDTDEGAPWSLRLFAPEADCFPLPRRRRLADRGLRVQLQQNDSALRWGGGADARTRGIAGRASGRRRRSEREKSE